MPNLWTREEHVARYLSCVKGKLPHLAEADATLLELVPSDAGRVLDLGTGDGRVLALLLETKTVRAAVGTDFSLPMLEAARHRFAADPRVEIVEADLDDPLPDLGVFDTVVSAFAIHHVPDVRKESLYAEVLGVLRPGGMFLNVEHVASPTENLHREFLAAIGTRPEDDDPSNILAPLEAQLAWLRGAGFVDVDCQWKWRELALLAGRAPHGA